MDVTVYNVYTFTLFKMCKSIDRFLGQEKEKKATARTLV